ncbi:Ankyrin repeat protein [Entamoeba marina]
MSSDHSFHYLCSTGKLSAVKKFVDDGGDANALDDSGYAPIHYAIAKGHDEVFGFLKDHHCEKTKTRLGLSCLHLAIMYDRFSIVEDLLDQKNETDGSGETPLMYAAQFHRNNFLMYLLKKKVNINASSVLTGETALHKALTYGNAIGAAELIRNGSKITATSSIGLMPFNKLHFTSKLHTIKSNIKVLHSPPYSVVNEKLFESSYTDDFLISSKGKKFPIHKCVCSQYTIPDHITSAALEIYIEWMYLQKSPILESQDIESTSKIIVELLKIECLRNYLAAYIISKPGLIPKSLLKIFSDKEVRSGHINLAKYILLKVFENFDEQLKLASIVESLPLLPEPQQPIEITPKKLSTVSKPKKVSSTTIPMTALNKKLCSKLIQEISGDPNINIFMNPVNEERDGAPRYYEIIKKPICLSEIKNRLRHGKYKNTNEFIADVRLIWENSKAYNYVGSPVHNISIELSNRTEKLWKSFSFEKELLTDEKIKELKQKRAQEARGGNVPSLPKKKRTDEIVIEFTDNEQNKQPKIHKKNTTKTTDRSSITALSESLQSEIPSILHADQTGTEFELNLETMSNSNLEKLEKFCDQHAH